MAAAKVDGAVEEVAAEVRCADVVVEEKEEDEVVAVEVERAVAGGARGTTTGSPETTELESRLKTREEVVARVTGEPLRTMCPRRVRRLTQLLTPREKKKSPPKKLNQSLQESSLLKSLRLRLLGKRRRSK